MRRNGPLGFCSSSSMPTSTRCWLLLGSSVQLVGVVLLCFGILSIPCGILMYLPLYTIVNSQWHDWVVLLLLFAPLLIIPGSVLCIHAGRHIRRASLPQGCCPRCGYDMRGDHAACCPECGWGRAADASA